MKLTVIQALPALHAGGVERGTIEIAEELVRRDHRAIVISAGGQLVKELLAVGGEHIEMPIGNKSPGGLLLIRRLKQVVQSCGANVLHARSRFPAWISYLAWASMDRETRPRFVTSVHGPYSVNPYSKIMLRGERVIAISEYIRNYIGNNYPDVDMGKVTVIPRGISPDSFPFNYQPPSAWLASWHQQYPELKGKFILTLPARITRWKGQEDFIEIVARLRQMKIDAHGIIAGGVEKRRVAYQKELESLASSRGVEKNITFTGHRSDMKDIMSVSRLVLSLAREPEAFGRTSLEALGLGVPVLAYDHGGASEVLNRIFPAGLVDPNNIEAVCQRVFEFYKSMPAVPDNNPFTLQKMLDSTLDLYQEISSG